MQKPLIGAALHSDQISTYKQLLFTLPVLEIENFLFPGFSDSEFLHNYEIKESLKAYSGKILLSGPYIDLNPGSPERLVIEACRTRMTQAYRFAFELGAREIIFLSTFLPFIYLPAYEEDWCQRSAQFWQEFIDSVDARITISLCNTFEFHPDYLCRIAKNINRPNFKLAFDVGHFLVYSRMDLPDWLNAIQPYCQTVYMHSNLGTMDTHDEPYMGKLTAEMVYRIFKQLNPDTVWIIKTFSKENLISSIAWLEKCVSS